MVNKNMRRFFSGDDDGLDSRENNIAHIHTFQLHTSLETCVCIVTTVSHISKTKEQALGDPVTIWRRA